MKAIRLHGRGGPEQLFYGDAPEPMLGADDALVRVYATGITPAELTWDETYSDCAGAERIPSIPGHELSGIVEQVAPGVGGLAPGDEVYGLTSFCRDGAAADLIAVKADDLAPKPRTLSHLQAAAVPLSALTVWQAFFNHAKLRPGQRVLVHAIAGGVGTFAIQIGKWMGLHIIGTASASNHDFLRKLGADELIDYTKQRFENEVSDVDLVIDTIGGDTRERSWQVLKPDGMLIALNAPIEPGDEAKHRRRGLFFVVEPNRKELTEIANLIDSGRIAPVIAQSFALAQARDAFELGVKGHTRGKIVLRVSGD